MKKNVFYFLATCFTFLIVASATNASAGRLNFMLTNLTPQDITEVSIAPTNAPYNSTGNLLNTKLEANTRLYIGPNFYGSQRYWSISLKWANGVQNTWHYNRLTRNNSYTAYVSSTGNVNLRQGFERAFNRPGYGGYGASYMHQGSFGSVSLSTPEKINVANAPSPRQQQQQMVASNTRRSTRDLVFDEDDEVAVPTAADSIAATTTGKKISVKATVELTRDGKQSTVLPTENFKSGDKVRLIFTSNTDGYVYWVAKGTSGQYQVLFPGKKVGTDNTVVRNKEYTVPNRGAWRFDDKKGTETVVCLLAPNKIDELENAIKQAEGGDKAAASATIAALVDKHETERTTRDLVFEEEDNDDVNTKIQTSSGDEPFVGTYELNHL